MEAPQAAALLLPTNTVFTLTYLKGFYGTGNSLPGTRRKERTSPPKKKRDLNKQKNQPNIKNNKQKTQTNNQINLKT